VDVRVDTAGEDQQPSGVEFFRPCHRAAELRDPAIPDADVGDFLPTLGDDRSASDH
jgi:hypothetical protein